MKNNGLKNRFSGEVRAGWTFHNYCLWCGESGWNVLHHIKSPQSSDYVDGDFNKSILNSCPIHNNGCHLYNTELHKIENERILLIGVLQALLKSGYKLNEMDREFIEAYKKSY